MRRRRSRTARRATTGTRARSETPATRASAAASRASTTATATTATSARRRDVPGRKLPAGEDLSCPAPSMCEMGYCDSELGCAAVPVEDGRPCDDGDAATDDDICRSGVCEGTVVGVTDACADAFGKPGGARLGLRTDASGMHVIWDAPAHPDGAVVQYRLEAESGWTSVRGEVTRVDDCWAEYRADRGPGLLHAIRLPRERSPRRAERCSRRRYR